MLPRQKAFLPGSGIEGGGGHVFGAGHTGHCFTVFWGAIGGGGDKLAVFDGKKLNLKSAGMKNK